MLLGRLAGSMGINLACGLVAALLGPAAAATLSACSLEQKAGRRSRFPQKAPRPASSSRNCS